MNVNPGRIRTKQAWIIVKSGKHRFRIVKHNPIAKMAAVEAINDFVDTVPVEKCGLVGRSAGEMDTTALYPAAATVHRRPRKFGLTFMERRTVPIRSSSWGVLCSWPWSSCSMAAT